jgi:hypothetical protein
MVVQRTVQPEPRNLPSHYFRSFFQMNRAGKKMNEPNIRMVGPADSTNENVAIRTLSRLRYPMMAELRRRPRMESGNTCSLGS